MNSAAERELCRGKISYSYDKCMKGRQGIDVDCGAKPDRLISTVPGLSDSLLVRREVATLLGLRTAIKPGDAWDFPVCSESSIAY